MASSGGVARDLLVRCPGIPQEVTGRVGTDHHRTLNAVGITPGVDHRGARAGALAEQIDALVAERAPGSFEIINSLRQRVSREVDTIALQPLGALAEGIGARSHGFLTEQIAGPLHCRADLGTVEPDRAVDAAIADEDDVVSAGELTGLAEPHVGDTGTAFEAEDRLCRMRGPRPDPDHRKRDQARLYRRPVLRHDERATVGGISPALGSVPARLEREIAGLRPCGNRKRALAGREVEISES